MIDPKIETAFIAALEAFSKYNSFDATQLTDEFGDVFASDEDFLGKVALLDEVFDENPQIEDLREVFFDLLMINFFSADVKKLEEDYLDTPEWESIEEETLDRGTELLNLLLYLNECEDEEIEPELEDYLKEFLLVDEDEFQDEYRIDEPIIANQILVESPVAEISKIAASLPEDSELKELFYPVMCFFQNIDPTDEEINQIAANSENKEFDIAVLQILLNFE
jgi:NTP pyrophosphatase (non-canonical NTP hydrolase)